ncbi:MAG: xanthine dehydrogenase family protein subunit M [Deltaproteobacteria bacterium]|nr:xanthine dehydrogenase family protein subunit M [Deltaproteobacteria bacterium]
MSSRILPEFELLPHDIDEAVKMLGLHQGKASIMAGGTDLLVMMGDGFRADYVLSLGNIPDLAYIIEESGKWLRIGAMTTLAEVAESKVVQEKYTALWQSAAQNGSPQTRNMGTVVGNLLRASPSGDCCCAVLALDGWVVLEGPQGRREVAIDDFWLEYRATARRPDEIAVEVKLPDVKGNTTSAFRAMTRTTLDLAKLNAAVRLDMSGKQCENARVAIGAVAPTTIRVRKAEELIRGKEINEETLEEVGKVVSTEVSPIDDVRSTAEYRRTISGVLVKRVIEEACKGV